jgi:hypothetical protein
MLTNLLIISESGKSEVKIHDFCGVEEPNQPVMPVTSLQWPCRSSVAASSVMIMLDR